MLQIKRVRNVLNHAKTFEMKMNFGSIVYCKYKLYLGSKLLYFVYLIHCFNKLN